MYSVGETLFAYFRIYTLSSLTHLWIITEYRVDCTVSSSAQPQKKLKNLRYEPEGRRSARHVRVHTSDGEISSREALHSKYGG